MTLVARQSVKQIVARVFGCPTAGKAGGNPVTVFVWENLAVDVREDETRFASLSRSCSWESVHVIDHPKEQLPKYYFYMPSGENVPFCAHAAMGACAALTCEKGISKEGEEELLSVNFEVADNENEPVIHSAKYGSKSSKVELAMQYDNFEEQILSSKDDINALKQLLHAVGLDIDRDVVYDCQELPFNINSSVARNKTLIPIVSLERLHAATNPKFSNQFRDACDFINSTGLYLYCPIENSSITENEHQSFECRQFPRASGYPEDPATGIAAAALTCSLQARRNPSSTQSKEFCKGTHFHFYQGTAMGKRSQIDIKYETIDSGKTLLYCSGNVDIDHRTVLQL